MNILVTINKKYLKILFTMLNSLSFNNSKHILNVYVVANDLTISDFKNYHVDNVKFTIIHFEDEILDSAPASKRYPSVIYYRLLAAKFLPNDLDRILYLDPDIIVLKDLSDLYNSDFNGNYYIGSSNVKNILRKFNEVKNGAPKKAPYLNTGVLLINLKELRKFDQSKEVYNFILKKRMTLMLPDQDVLQGLYGDKVLQIDHLKYNLSDRTITLYNLKHLVNKIDLNWVDQNCSIIHYFGRNKPWKKSYRGILQDYYLKYEYKEAEL